MKRLHYIFILVAVVTLAACGGAGNKESFEQITNDIGRKTMLEDYPKVPHSELLAEAKGNMLYAELAGRYNRQLAMLQNATNADGVKLVVVIMSPEAGRYASPENIHGVPYIVQTCANLGVNCVNLMPDIAEWTGGGPGRGPVRGNWSAEGATFLAGMLQGVVASYEGYSSKRTDTKTRPATFGDGTPDVWADDDGMPGADATPKVTINNQGLRGGALVTFPKKKQRIFFLGDGRIMQPELSDEETSTAILQARMPEVEIWNAGHTSYTMDDYLSLYAERVRFAQPDVVVVCTNGGDIPDEYFSHRNRYSRTHLCYRPTPLEEKTYRELYK